MTERDRLIIDLYQKGSTASEIAKIINFSEGTVFRVLRKNKITKHLKRIELTREDELDICELYKNYNSLLSIQNKYNISYERVVKILTENNISLTNTRSKTTNPTLIENYFEQIDTPEKAYWLGWLITDGCITNNKIQITISSKDEYILHLFEKDLQVQNKVSLKNGYSNFSLGSIKLCKDLAELSIVPNKTFTVSIPDLPNELYPHLIRGIFDGDGGISCYVRKNNSLNYELSITGNEQVIQKIKDILENNIPALSKKVIEHNHSVYRLRWGSKKDIKLLTQYLYANHNNHYLIRKYEKLLELC